jgi:LEA14-like dessication related protein
MAAKKWLAALVGAAAVYWVYSKYRFSQGVSFVISRVGLGGSILDPQINIEVTIYNPTAFQTELSNVMAQLYLASGLKIADVYYNKKTIIKANSQVNLPFVAVTTLEGAITSIREIISSRKADFRLAGTAQVDGVLLPFDIKYSFNGF